MKDNTKEDNEKVILVYTNHFKAHADPHLYDEHPKQGRIYRAVYNSDHKLFKIAFYDESKEAEALAAAALGGIIVKELDTNNDSWEYSFTEIKEANLPSLAIEPDDYLKLADWTADPTKGIEELLTGGDELKQYEVKESDTNQEELDQIIASLGVKEEQPTNDSDYHETWEILKSSNPPLAKAYRSVMSSLLETHTVESVLLSSPAPEILAHGLVNKSIIDYIEGGESHKLYDAIATLIVLLNINKEV